MSITCSIDGSDYGLCRSCRSDRSSNVTWWWPGMSYSALQSIVLRVLISFETFVLVSGVSSSLVTLFGVVGAILIDIRAREQSKLSIEPS